MKFWIRDPDKRLDHSKGTYPGQAVMLRKAGLWVQVTPPGVPLFIYSFSKPLASVCDMPEFRVLSPTSSRSPFLIFPVPQTPGLFLVCPGHAWLDQLR